MTSISSIVERLWAPIPPAPVKPSRSAKTWRKLKPGDLIENTRRMVLGKFNMPPGTKWTVSSVDSNGAVITSVDNTSVSYRLENDLWEEDFNKLKKPRKSKTKGEPKP